MLKCFILRHSVPFSVRFASAVFVSPLCLFRVFLPFVSLPLLLGDLSVILMHWPWLEQQQQHCFCAAPLRSVALHRTEAALSRSPLVSMQDTLALFFRS